MAIGYDGVVPVVALVGNQPIDNTGITNGGRHSHIEGVDSRGFSSAVAAAEHHEAVVPVSVASPYRG